MYYMSNMAESMNVSLPAQSSEPTDNAYSEVVNISLDNSATKKYLCNLCEFKGNDRGGMTRHIKSKHRTAGQKQKRDESVNEGFDEKKPKVDEYDFDPQIFSTQATSSGNSLNPSHNRTASELSNESLANLFSDQFEFSRIHADDDMVDGNKVDSEKKSFTVESSNSVRMPRADVALLNIRLGKLEEDLKRKTLECVEKEGIIEALENENCILKEDLEKAKDDNVVKSKVIEGNIARINTVEEELKRKSDRINILEPAVNRILSKNYKSPPRKDSKEVVNYENELKTKNQIIKQLSEDKNELANELKETQEKLHSNMVPYPLYSNSDQVVRTPAYAGYHPQAGTEPQVSSPRGRQNFW